MLAEKLDSFATLLTAVEIQERRALREIETEEKTKESKRLTPLISRVVVFYVPYDERRLRNDTDSKERCERDKRRRKARPSSSGT
jgi:hypothetical protein